MSASPHTYVPTVEGLCALCGQRPMATVHLMPEDSEGWPPVTTPPSFTIPPLTELDGFAYLTEALGHAMRATGEWLVVTANKVERKT